MNLTELPEYFGLLGVVALICVHWTLYKCVKYAMSRLFDDKEAKKTFMSIPLPMWANLVIFHFSFFFTGLLIWLILLT